MSERKCFGCGQLWPDYKSFHAHECKPLTTSHAQGEDDQKYLIRESEYDALVRERDSLNQMRDEDRLEIRTLAGENVQMRDKITELTQALKAAEVDVRMANAMFVQERRDFDKLKAENDRLRQLLTDINNGKYKYYEQWESEKRIPSFYDAIDEALKDPEVML